MSLVRSKRLFTLFELMKIFNTADFLTIMKIVGLYNQFEWVRQPSIWERKPSKNLSPNVAPIFKKWRSAWESDLANLEHQCRDVDLGASVATIQKMRRELHDWEANSHQRLTTLSEELVGRLIDETPQRVFFSLSLEESNYYTHPQQGWNRVIERFGNAVMDIEEAHKCFALSRYAGAVFHSVQIVECGLIELGTFIKVSDPKSGWTAVTQQLRKIMKTDYTHRTDFEKAQTAFLEQILATIEALQTAWRNKISHSQGRLMLLTSDFLPDIAQEILSATRSFMRRLADGLPDKTNGTSE